MLLQGFVNLLLFLSASSWHSVLRMFKKLSAVISLNFLSSNKRSALWGHLMRLTLSFTLLRMPTYDLTSFGDEDNLWSYRPAIVPFSKCRLERSFSRKRGDVSFTGSFSRPPHVLYISFFRGFLAYSRSRNLFSDYPSRFSNGQHLCSLAHDSFTFSLDTFTPLSF